ncbi:MAG: ABC transporter ATP-binding protein [Elainellaceae cyanobacterium]
MIEAEHLSKVYGSTAAIEDVTFSVEPGEILGFLGPNGAGKTTTMRILTGYLPATRGTARVAGFDVHADSMEVRRHIGYLPETPPLYPEMTVEGFLHFVARLKGISTGDRQGRVNSAIKRCNLEEKRSTMIRKLSKGFRQRVGIAQAIVHDPPVIVLDEPTVGLDPRQIIDVRNLITSLAGDHTIILSTHILPEVSATCDRVTIINRGRMVATNTPSELVAQLQGGSSYDLTVAGELGSVGGQLLAIAGVKSLETVEGDRLPDGRYRLRVGLDSSEQVSQEIGPDIAAMLVQSGLRLYEMKCNQATLEDVFLELTMTEQGVASEVEPDPEDNQAEHQEVEELSTEPVFPPEPQH